MVDNTVECPVAKAVASCIDSLGYFHSPEVVVIDGKPFAHSMFQSNVLIALGLEELHPVDPVTETEADRIEKWLPPLKTRCNTCNEIAYLFDGYCAICVQDNYDRQAAAFGHLG